MKRTWQSVWMVVALVVGLFGVLPVSAADTYAPQAIANDVVISEIMYDSKSGTDVEWVELFNTTNSTINVGGWVLTDNADAACSGTEGCLTLPSGTTIASGGFLIVAVTNPGISGAVVGVKTGSFILGNSGDNIALYNGAPSSSSLIFGSHAVLFPDSAGSNVGDSIALNDPSAGWIGSSAGWTAQTTLATANLTEFAHCTPAAANDGWETTAPSPLSNQSLLGTGPITISWTNPSDADLAGIVVVRRDGAYPTGNPTSRTQYAVNDVLADGIVVCVVGRVENTNSVPSTCIDAAGGTNSYYSLFTFDEVRNYSAAIPLAVSLASFTAQASGDGVTVAWETVSETANAGFNVYRGDAEAGPWKRLNAALIPAAAPGSSGGHAYAWTDASAGAGQRYWYLLEDVALDGAATRHGPVALTPLAPNAVGLHQASASAAFRLRWAGFIGWLRGQLIAH